MGGMPILEFSNWLHQVTTFYVMAVPFYVYLNNFVGPRTMEPVFCRDYLMAQFDRMATPAASSTAATASAVVKPQAYVPTPGKVPQLPKNMFARAATPRGRVVGLAAAGLAGLFQPAVRRQ